MAISAALLLWEIRDQIFFNDEWVLLLHRRGDDVKTLLRAQNGHFVAVPVLIYKVLVQLFGTASYVPYRITLIGLGLLWVGLLYVLCRRRAGPWLALAPAVLTLFLGVAWEQLLWPLGHRLRQPRAGLGMLLALIRAPCSPTSPTFATAPDSSLGRPRSTGPRWRRSSSSRAGWRRTSCQRGWTHIRPPSTITCASTPDRTSR